MAVKGETIIFDIMKLRLSLLLSVLLCVCLQSCANEEPLIKNDIDINIEKFPVIDGSDSTDPLRTIIMCKLLGFDYNWGRRPFTQDPEADIKEIYPEYTCTDDERHHLETVCLKHSNTHQSFINLIDDKVELVIAARSISRDEMAYAINQDVAIIEKPIAKDALTFMVNPVNPVNNLSISQLQGIYTGEITNWKEVGGSDEQIRPYVRNRNSGSQEKFETLVMEGLQIAEFPELQVGLTMMSPYYQLEDDKQGIGFSPFYYYSVIVDNGSTKAISIDGVMMTKENIRNNTYPYTTEVYAAVRSDINQNSAAYELFEFLTTPAGQEIINESGYLPLFQGSSIREINEDDDIILSTVYTDLNGVHHNETHKGIVIKTDTYYNGKRKSSKICTK